MNWMAKSILRREIVTSIQVLENLLKETSQLIKTTADNKSLDKKGLEYFSSQIDEYKEAINQLKEFEGTIK